MERGLNKQLEECTEQLLDAVRNSEAYLNFEHMKKEIAGHPELRAELDEFRRKVYLMQNSSEAYNLMDELADLHKEKERLYLNPLIGEYLNAELHVCRMLQKISMKVLSVADLEIESFELSISI